MTLHEINDIFNLFSTKRKPDEVDIPDLLNFLTLLSKYESNRSINTLEDYLKQFHEENSKKIESIQSSISRSIDQRDAVIYILSFLIFRYQVQANLLSDSAVLQFRTWFNQLTEPGLDMNLFTYMFTKQINNVQPTIYAIQNNLIDNKLIREMYWLTRILLYDDYLLDENVIYKSESRPGFYVLYNILTTELYNLGRMDRPQSSLWKEKFNQYCSLKENLNPFYSIYPRLQFALTYGVEEKEKVMDLVSTIELPSFDEISTVMTHGDLTLLQSMYLLVLSNLGEHIKISNLCDEIITGLKSCNYESRWYFDYICKYKSDSLDMIENADKNKWFYDLIKDFNVDSVGNLVFLMPQLSNSSDDIMVYHYSDVASLKSIIDNKQLWLTRFDYLNDTEEVKFTYDIIKNFLSSNYLDHESLNGFIDFLKACVELLECYFGEKESTKYEETLNEIRNTISKVYVLSTSLKEDNLSLWHYYSGGTGASIKFSTAKLRQLVELNNNAVRQMSANLFMKKIDYLDISESKNIIDSLRLFYKNSSSLSDNQKLYLGCINILFEGIFKKNINMQQEEEYRFVLIAPDYETAGLYNHNKIVEKYRVKNNSLVMPYIELNVDPLILIDGIKIAPLNKTDIAKRGMVDFLKSKDLINAENIVSLSDIRLRY